MVVDKVQKKLTVSARGGEDGSGLVRKISKTGSTADGLLRYSLTGTKYFLTYKCALVLTVAQVPTTD